MKEFGPIKIQYENHVTISEFRLVGKTKLLLHCKEHIYVCVCVCVCICVLQKDVLSIMVITLEMELVTRVQILDETVFHIALGKL